MKLALLFGSFNPIHVGHVALATYIIDHTDLDRLWFVVSPQNPFKNIADLASVDDRLAMVRCAIADNDQFDACDVEFNMPKPSYTSHTLAHLKTIS